MCHSGSDFLIAPRVFVRSPVSGCARICTGSSCTSTCTHDLSRVNRRPLTRQSSYVCMCACVCVCASAESASDRPGSCVHAAAGRCSLHVVRCTPRHWRRITGTGLWGHCSLPRCAHHPPARPVGRRASRELQHILVLERLRKNTNHPRQSRDATVSMAPRSRRCGASRTPPPATPHLRPARQASPGAARDCAPRGRASARRGEAASAA